MFKIMAAKTRPTPIFHGRSARPQYLVPAYNVYEAARDRMRWLFREFDGQVGVFNSGGKDSTVIVELAAAAAKETGHLPLNVFWLDQECEFQSTVDYQRYLMYERDDINFHWYQIPFQLENSTNHENHWLNVWGEGEEWVRPKEPGSIHDNVYGQNHFNELLEAIREQDWQGAMLDGMRAEESPSRRLRVTSSPQYKWITWSNRRPRGPLSKPDRRVWRFQPIYDWSYRDVWKAIHENGWRYNAHYDRMFQYGVPVRQMRVSNYHHESSLSQLQWLQEVEPETWEAATRRLEGISTYGHLRRDQYPSKLPYMFASWEEYAAYLLDNLVTNDEYREMFRKQWNRMIKTLPEEKPDQLARVMVNTIIGNDFWGTHVGNYIQQSLAKRQAVKSER